MLLAKNSAWRGGVAAQAWVPAAVEAAGANSRLSPLCTTSNKRCPSHSCKAARQSRTCQLHSVSRRICCALTPAQHAKRGHRLLFAEGEQPGADQNGGGRHPGEGIHLHEHVRVLCLDRKHPYRRCLAPAATATVCGCCVHEHLVCCPNRQAAAVRAPSNTADDTGRPWRKRRGTNVAARKAAKQQAAISKQDGKLVGCFPRPPCQLNNLPA